MKYQTPIWKSRTVLALLAILVLMGAWRWFVFHLYSLPPAALPAYQAVTISVFTVLGAIVMTMAGMKGVEKMVSIKSEATSLASSALQAVNERRESHEVIEHIERVVHEGDPGAPARRPFRPDESHEDTV